MKIVMEDGDIKVTMEGETEKTVEEMLVIFRQLLLGYGYYFDSGDELVLLRNGKEAE